MTDPGIENAARWGPEAALDSKDREQIREPQSNTNVHRLEPRGDDIEIDGIIWPLIPEGDYVARYTGCDTKYMFHGLKAFLHFEIVDSGPHFGTKLFRAYNVKPAGRTKKGEWKFKLVPRSQMFLDLCRVYERKQRRDRISLNGLKSMLLRIRVRTVNKDYQQRPLQESIKYSVVSDLIGREAGSKND